jgi:predicted cupin superfamily sugar epimerase
MTAEQIINFFSMKPLLNEGGWFVETYRAKKILTQAALGIGYSGPRSFVTAILYLLTTDAFSALHRLKSDEIFHFYLGDPVTMLQLHPDGSSRIITLGNDILKGQKIQMLVPSDAWQGTFVSPGGKFALLGCTVAPGFDSADYEQADRKKLLKQYPEHKELIIRLTRP